MSTLECPSLYALLDLMATVWSHISGMIAFFAFLMGLWAFFRYPGKTKAIPYAILGTVIITYCFLIFFGLNRDRYLIPILLIIPFGLALSIQRFSGFLGWRVSALALAAILLVNSLANFSDKRTRHPDYHGLAQFLESKGLNSGYAPYKAAYPLVYLSNERLIYTPAFHEPQFDRYSDYTTITSRSKSPAFLFDATEDIASFRAKLELSRIAARHATFHHYTAFHELSPRTDIDKLK
jgi:hypothetical protein